MRAAILFIAGLAAGIGLVVACDQNGVGVDAGRPVDASPSDCAVWQVANMRAHPVDTTGTPSDLPAGWEPFSAFGGSTPDTANIYVRRCRP